MSDAERPEAVSNSGVSALHHLQLFSPLTAAGSARRQGDGRVRAGTNPRTPSGEGLRLGSDARACSSTYQ